MALLCAALACLAALLSLPSAASAARGHVFDPTLTLGAPCTEEPCAPGKLKEPSAVAVNEATGNVYVLDQGNDRVEVFDGATGALVDEFDGSETPAGSFEFEAHPENGALAVDNYCALHELAEPKCKEEDPSDGDVYVVDGGENHRVVDKFEPNGNYLGQITEGGGVPFLGHNKIDGVATDPGGALWIYLESRRAYGFSNAEPNSPGEAVQLQIGGFGLSGFAVDSIGSFYARFRSGATEARIGQTDHAGKALAPELDPEDSSAVAVDQTTDTAFVDNLTSVAALDPDGTEVERLGEEEGEHHLSEGAGIGVDAHSEFLYVADSAAGKVIAFEPKLPEAPLIEPGQFVSAVTATEATLNAELNPQSEPGSAEEATTYRFQYGPCATPTTCATSPFPLETPAGSLPPDFEPHPVVATVTGLAPATTYHYRLTAENEHGPASGEEGTFATQPIAPFALPDARQWQLVSPPHKLGARIEPISETGVVQAAADGSGITYLASTPTGAEPQGYSNREQILSTRAAEGWSTRDIAIPNTSATGFAFGPGPEHKAFNSELTLSVVQPFGEFNPGLSEEASESTAYLDDLAGACGSACFRPLVTGKPGFENVPEGTRFGEDELCGPHAKIVCGPEFLGASEDLGQVVLGATAPLVAGAGANQLYEWSDGVLSQVSELPSHESAPPGLAKLGLENRSARNAISADGSRVVFEAEPNLYLRDTALEKTIQLDAGEGCGACESGGGRFQIASAEGSRIFFTDTRRLTPDSGAETEHGGKADLYECRITVEAGEPRCDFADLTPKRGEESAGVRGQVLGASADGSYLYFVAKGVLTAAPNSGGEEAVAGKPNLYLRHGSVTSFIATLAEGDEHDWGAGLGQPTRVSPNGRFLGLMSEASLTGYDNRDATTGRPAAEVYLYDAAAERLLCASCDPSGARPHGVEYFRLDPHWGGLVGGPREIWGEGLVAANVPGTTAIYSTPWNRYQPRYLSDSGRLFFNSGDALVPADSNGTEDVYQYEPPGVGGCSESSPTFGASSGGCVDLISSGTSGEESAFLDASESGDDVFFLTASKLVPQDEDSALDVYDAHACSAASPCLPEPPAPAPLCQGDACQQPAVPPVDQTPGSLTFNGAGNVKECPKGKRLKGGKCVKKQSAKKKGKKKNGKGKQHNKGKKSAKRGGGK